MMSEAMDDVMDDGGAEEEEDRIVQQVLDELGVAATELVCSCFWLACAPPPSAFPFL